MFHDSQRVNAEGVNGGGGAKPLHIAFFNRAFYPEVSATGQLLTELAQGLANDHGCRVSVVTGIPQGTTHGNWASPKGWKLVYTEQMGRIEILRARGTTWPKRFLFGRITNYLTYFGSACLAGFYLKKPDVVIALTDPPIIGLAALLAAHRFKATLVISYRDLFPEVARLLEEFRNPLIEKMLHQGNRILMGQADRIVALGEAMRRRLIEEKGARPEQVVIIPDWADTSAIQPGPKCNSFSLAHGLVDCFVVMHSGNMGASQNLEVLLKAAVLLKDLSDLRILFIGEGVKKPFLQSEATRLGLTCVRFLPYQPKEQLSNTFSAADCFVVSLKAGLSGYIMPSKLYGILAAGRPYVAAVDEGCDVARITRASQSGLLAKTEDALDLAEKIRILYQDRSLCQRLGSNARRASEAFDLKRGVKAYFNLCQELVRV